MDKAIGSDGAGHANDETCNMYVVCRVNMYRVVFLTGPPDFQYQNEKQVAANQD